MDKTIVPIYNLEGNQTNQIEIDDKLVYDRGRVWKGTQHYYKGTGIPYQFHHTLTVDKEDDYDDIIKTDVFYMGYRVSRKVWKNKTGIFQSRYQPFFPDYIGGCSVKEKTIVDNSRVFKRSSVDILDVVNYDPFNKQYYFKMDYKCDRKEYIDHNGDPKKLTELLEYMLDSEWNFLWDKAAISDVTPDGLISDTADLFESDELKHQFGSVYSLLFSLYNTDKRKYAEFLHLNGLKHEDTTDFIFNSVELLDRNNIDTIPLIKYNERLKDYKHIILEYLLQGRNCAYCSCMLFVHEGDMVRDDYIKRITEELKVI